MSQALFQRDAHHLSDTLAPPHAEFGVGIASLGYPYKEAMLGETDKGEIRISPYRGPQR